VGRLGTSVFDPITLVRAAGPKSGMHFGVPHVANLPGISSMLLPALRASMFAG
jgi:hypothetical protein